MDAKRELRRRQRSYISNKRKETTVLVTHMYTNMSNTVARPITALGNLLFFLLNNI